MKEILATLTGRGQVTVPAEVRRLLGTVTGDKLAFVIDDRGEVRVAVPHYADVASVRGAAGRLQQPVQWNEMRDLAREDRLSAEPRQSR